MHTNFQYLQIQLALAGFDGVDYNALQQKMMALPSKIIIPYYPVFCNDASVELHIVKWDDCPFYYFSKFKLVIRNKQFESPLCRDFYSGSKKDPLLTLSDAFHLLNGKLIYKNNLLDRAKLTLFTAWLQLDFNTTDGNGNFKIQYFKTKTQSHEDNYLCPVLVPDKLHNYQTSTQSEIGNC